MIVEFATNQPAVARRYLAVAFPNAGDDLQAVLEEVVQLVADGKARVRDPHMYGGNTAIVPEKGHEGECVAVHERLQAASLEDYYLQNPEKRPAPPFVPKDLSPEKALELIERMRAILLEWADYGVSAGADVHLDRKHDGLFYKVRPKADVRRRLGKGDELRTLTADFTAPHPYHRHFPADVTVYGPHVPKITRKPKAAA